MEGVFPLFLQVNTLVLNELSSTCFYYRTHFGKIKPTMNNMLDILNPQQQKAVTAPPGPTLVLAGPGSGKTRVLTYRIAYLIGALEIPPYNILAVTFTNKAAREMATRVESIISSQSQGLWLGTFHAICGRILRYEADLLPVSRNFVIFDQDDQLSLMKSVIREFRADEKLFRPASVLDSISKAKNELLGPEDYIIQTYRDEQVQKFYGRYQKLLVQSNAMDFDDMLMYTANLLSQVASVRANYAHKFEHILVDEFQDTNLAQYNILYHLASQHKNLFLVGEEDQSIYRWRGADYRNIQRFEKDFKQTNKILLEQNYRSSQVILDTAVAVIDRNPNRTHKSLFTNLKGGEKVTLHTAYDDHEEAAYVVESISQLMRSKKANPSDFAIMYRTNAQSRLLEEEFRRAGINYRLVGAQRFYGRREVKDLVAYLRLVYNPLDEVSLARVINTPPRGIGQKTIEKLKLAAQANDCSMVEVLLDLSKGEQSRYRSAFGSEGAKLALFGKLLSTWREFSEQSSLTELFDFIADKIGYHEYINDRSEEGFDRWENVMELRQVTLEYEDKGLPEFLEAMALVADQDTLPEERDTPTMLTLHAAKGLEFEHVIIIGLDEMLLPHSRSFDDYESMAEERRLFYVGITRAKRKLTLVRALRRRNLHGGYEETLPSRFLEDIPGNLLDSPVKRTSNYRSEFKSYFENRWEVPAYRYKETPKPQAEKQFKTGMQVQHPVYGKGVVRTSRLELGDETVEVFFENAGLKALVASMANLIIL